MPPILETFDRLRPKEELEAMRGSRTPDELQHQAESALGQLLCRAYCGDDDAIAKLILIIRNAVGSLERLAQHHSVKVRAKAETYPSWPVLLSLNPQDIKRAKNDLKSLGVGVKALTPTRSGQRIDPRNFWTGLANCALRACELSKQIEPLLEAHCVGAKRERKTSKYWGTPVKANVYTRQDGSLVIIADWQKESAKLSQPITAANFNDWWKVVRLCVLQNWNNPRGSYAEALRQVGQPGAEEWRRRDFALGRVKQALRSLT